MATAAPNSGLCANAQAFVDLMFESISRFYSDSTRHYRVFAAVMFACSAAMIYSGAVAGILLMDPNTSAALYYPIPIIMAAGFARQMRSRAPHLKAGQAVTIAAAVAMSAIAIWLMI